MGGDSGILVTGGAGYIGSHVVLALAEAGRRVVVVDDLSTGRRDLVGPGIPFIKADIADASRIELALADHRVTAVMHFAGSIVVPDSVADPLGYYANNVCASRALLAACVAGGVRHFVFSSTAAVYGAPGPLPIAEDAPAHPQNPYGNTKLAAERMIADVGEATGMAYANLRYFNVAGADAQGRAGQSAARATHLIKIACETALGVRPAMAIFGTDYATPDGTCVRDFIHVSDLAAAHTAALDYLEAGGDSITANCGYGRGHSVREVVAAVERAAGHPLAVTESGRRPGDVAALVADNRLIRERLGWRPRLDDLDAMVASALAWERRQTEQGETSS